MADAPFTALAACPDPALDRLTLALAAEFGPVDAPAALERLDALGAELRAEAGTDDPAAQARALSVVLGERHGFGGREEDYDDPRLSMLDQVLERRRGLPILLSVVYQEAARRAGWPVWGVGMPGHFVVGHFGGPLPQLLDPYRGGVPLPPALAPGAVVRPWRAQEIAARMLSNLVRAYTSRFDLVRGIRAAELRAGLPADAEQHDVHVRELRALRARLN